MVGRQRVCPLVVVVVAVAIMHAKSGWAMCARIVPHVPAGCALRLRGGGGGREVVDIYIHGTPESPASGAGRPTCLRARASLLPQSPHHSRVTA